MNDEAALPGGPDTNPTTRRNDSNASGGTATANVTFNAVPLELRERRQWVVWKLVERDGQPKPTKEPWQVDARRRASSTDSSTWSTFEEASIATATGGFDGIGFVFTEGDPFVGIDFDACWNGNGPTGWKDAWPWISRLDSFTEWSPSGHGAHVIVRGTIPDGLGHKNKHVEIYDRARFFTITGSAVVGTSAAIEKRQPQVEELLQAVFPPRAAPVPRSPFPPVPVDLDDRDLIDRALTARNGHDFFDLWNGNWEHRYMSQSEADLALCSALAFWTGRDADRIDRLFRESLLYREKWDRDDYRERTIDEAVAGCRSVYSGGSSERTQGKKSDVSEGKKTASPAETERYGLTDSALKESVSPESVPQRVHPNTGTDSDPESVTDPERPFSLPIQDFIAREREHREPLLANVDGRAAVGRHSLTLLGALGGHGKTTLFVDLALHLAAGVDYPPFTVPSPVSILIIENEGPEELFAEKLEGRLASFPHELKARLDVCTFDWGGFSLADATTRELLIREIAEKQYDLVFGDPLDSLGIEGVGSPEDTRKFLALMKETGLNKTVAWWLNTHPRKEETKEALNEISGAWGGKPDSVFLLRMLDDDRTQVRQPKLRWAKRGKGPTLLLAFDPETEAYTYLGEESEEERDYLALVGGLLADGEWRIAKEIAAPAKSGGIGANVDTVKKVLEEHPDVFESRTGEAAKALGRKPQATVWQLLSEEREP